MENKRKHDSSLFPNSPKFACTRGLPDVSEPGNSVRRPIYIQIEPDLEQLQIWQINLRRSCFFEINRIGKSSNSSKEDACSSKSCSHLADKPLPPRKKKKKKKKKRERFSILDRV